MSRDYIEPALRTPVTQPICHTNEAPSLTIITITQLLLCDCFFFFHLSNFKYKLHTAKAKTSTVVRSNVPETMHIAVTHRNFGQGLSLVRMYLIIIIVISVCARRPWMCIVHPAYLLEIDCMLVSTAIKTGHRNYRQPEPIQFRSKFHSHTALSSHAIDNFCFSHLFNWPTN